MKRLKIFQLTIIGLFIIFIIFFLNSTNYTKEYKVDDILVKETYNKEDKYYYFTFNYKNTAIDYLYETSYKTYREFVKEIKIIKNDEDFCLIPDGKKIEFIPLCYENDKIIYYKNVSSALKEQLPSNYLKEETNLNDTYKEINIYNRDYTYLLWNYNGFYYINSENEKEIKLFNNEKYNINLVSYTKDYLIIANYDDEYKFDKIYRLSFKDGSKKEIELDYEIYFDSYFPGYDENKLYIVDGKEELMYELNTKNGNISKTKAKILKENKWEEISIKTLLKNEEKFTYKTNYIYSLKDKTLLLTYKNEEISTAIDKDVTSIIRIKNNKVFYLKKDTLYVFEPLKGSTKLLSYFEWNFNFENMIYIN